MHDNLVNGGRQQRFLWPEFVVILLLCWAYAGSPPPGVNEPHYLSKAKHYWTPQWCAGDVFLESADAHAVFFWTFGWTTKFLSLTTVAWTGRLLAWTLFAGSWMAFVAEFSRSRWAASFSAAIYLAALQYGNLSGEWVIGGIEAKSIAFPLLFLGLTALVQGRWYAVFPWLGLASAFHALVGGWAVLAAGFAWLCRWRIEHLRWKQLVIPCLIGGGFALLAVVPAIRLSSGIDTQTARDANVIYVYLRLPHHLVVHDFAHWHIARFVLLAGATCFVAWRCRRDSSHNRLLLFMLGSLLIAVAGVVIDQCFLNDFGFSASLLRFYWYRLADAVVPSALAISALVWLDQTSTSRPRLAIHATRLLRGCAALCACYATTETGFLATSLAHQQETWSLSTRTVADNSSTTGPSEANVALQPRDDIAEMATAPVELIDSTLFQHDWRDACGWIRTHAPADAKFFTPMYQQTFKWYAERPELVTWKDVPQDARQLVAWWQLRRSVKRLGPNPLDDASPLIELVTLHGMTHVIWPRAAINHIDPRIEVLFENERFLVGRFVAAAGSGEANGAPSSVHPGDGTLRDGATLRPDSVNASVERP